MPQLKIDSSAFLCHSVCRAKCQPILGNNVIIFVEDSSAISVFNVETNYRNKILFTGHKKSILAMALSPVDQKFLCTCSRDCIMVWDFEALQSEDITACRKFTILTENGAVGQCCFSWDSNWLALCKDSEICLFQIKDSASCSFKPQFYTFIETSSTQGNWCTFSQEDPKLFVTAEGTCVKVWDIASVKLLSQCSVPGLSAISCCSFAPGSMRLLLGTSGGAVLVYVVNGTDNPYPVMAADVRKDFARRHGGATVDNRQDCGAACADVGCIVFSVTYYGQPECYPCEEADDSFSRRTYAMITKPGGQLLVCSNLGLSLYSCNSWQCLCLLPIADIFASKAVEQHHFLVHFLTVGGSSTDKILCASKVVMKESVLALSSLHVEKDDGSSDGVDEASYAAEKRTTVASYPLLAKSPLKKRSASPCRSGSSAYGKPLARPLVKPSKNSGKQQQRRFELPGFRDNLLLLGPPTKRRQSLGLGGPMALRTLAASANGNHLACSSGSKHIHVTSFSRLSDKDPILVGHDAAINSLHFSAFSRRLVSSSEDMTVRVWNLRTRRCDHVIDFAGRSPSPRTCQRISRAQFYFMDQFVLLSSGGQLELYNNPLGSKEPHLDVKGVPRRRLPRLVCRVKVPTHEVTCFSAVNSFYSFQVICGCLNKSIEAYDLNVQKLSLRLEAAHGRPPHRLRQLEGGSDGVAHCAGMHDLFLSTSVCDHVKLWDLRSARCVLLFSQHSSRTYKNGVDMSPCGRYVAVSADDKSVYVYDARKCDNYVGRLPQFSEVVTDLAFHRQRPLLAAVTLDGNLYSYEAVGKDTLLLP